MSNHAELTAIADTISATDPALACRLRALAARVRSQERCLDEIVEEGRLSARMQRDALENERLRLWLDYRGRR